MVSYLEALKVRVLSFEDETGPVDHPLNLIPPKSKL